MVTKSLSSDFSGNLKSEQFHQEILDSSITTSLNGINVTGNVVEIEFDGTLDAGETTTLNTLISNHVPDNSPSKKNFFTFDPRTSDTTATSYKTIRSSFKYAGSDEIGVINYIEIIGYKDSSPTSYAVRVYDVTNNNILAEKTGLTNTEEEIIDLGSISNIPTQSAILEIQAKRVGGNGNNKRVYIEHVVIYHGN